MSKKLEKMSKKELVEYALAEFGVKLRKKLSLAELTGKVKKLEKERKQTKPVEEKEEPIKKEKESITAEDVTVETKLITEEEIEDTVKKIIQKPEKVEELPVAEINVTKQLCPHCGKAVNITSHQLINRDMYRPCKGGIMLGGSSELEQDDDSKK